MTSEGITRVVDMTPRYVEERPREHFPPSAMAEPLLPAARYRYRPALGVSRQDWETPAALFDPVHRAFRFTVDVCAQPHNAKLPRFFSPSDDGLARSWAGETCWCNPPFADAAAWLEKALRSRDDGATTVMLLPAATDTDLFHRLVMQAAEIWFLRGRIRFVGAPGSPQSGHLLAVFRPGHRGHPVVKVWNWKQEPPPVDAHPAAPHEAIAPSAS